MTTTTIAPAQTATPIEFSVDVTAKCQHCEGELTATLYQGQVFPWFHRATGSERCAN